MLKMPIKPQHNQFFDIHPLARIRVSEAIPALNTLFKYMRYTQDITHLNLKEYALALTFIFPRSHQFTSFKRGQFDVVPLQT